MYYDFDKIKMYVIAIGIGITVLMSLWFQREKEKVREDLKDSRGGIKWTEEAAQNAAENYKTALENIEVSLSKYDYTKAVDEYRDASHEIERWTMNHGHRKLESGETLREWYAALSEDFHNTTVMNAVHIMLDRFARGEGRYADYKSVSHGFSGAYKYKIDQLFREKRTEITDARAAMAMNWVRLKVSATYTYYEAMAEDALISRWPDTSPFDLVVGKAFGNSESQATLKTISVHITEETALYESSEKNTTYGKTAAIPSKLKVTFSSKNSRTLPVIKSSWDELPTIEIEVALPKEYLFEFKNKRQRADFDNEIKKRREMLGEELKAALKKVPEFSTTEL